MISASPTILAVETDSAWAVVLVVSFVTLLTVLLLRRLIARPGGLAAGLLVSLPLILPLAAALIYRHAVLPEIGVLHPAAGAAMGDRQALEHVLLMPGDRPHTFIPYALTSAVGSWVVVVGVVVSSFMLLRRVVGFVAMKRTTARCSAIECPQMDDLVGTVERLATSAGMARAPEIRVLPEGTQGAFARGIRRGQILISRDLLEDLDADEIEAILAHEIAHLQAHDTLLTFIAGLARDVAAWNPLAHVAYRHMAVDRELEADRRAAELTGKPLAVASGLVKICDLMRRRRLTALEPHALLGFGWPRRPIGRRVSHLLALADGGATRAATGMESWLPFLVAVLLAVALALQSAVALVSNDQALAVVWGTRDTTVRTHLWKPPRPIPRSQAAAVRNAHAPQRAAKKHTRAEKGKALNARVYLQELKSAQAVAERDLETWMRTMTRVVQWDAHGWDVRPLFSSTEGSFGVYRLEKLALPPSKAL